MLYELSKIGEEFERFSHILQAIDEKTIDEGLGLV